MRGSASAVLGLSRRHSRESRLAAGRRLCRRPREGNLSLRELPPAVRAHVTAEHLTKSMWTA